MKFLSSTELFRRFFLSTFVRLKEQTLNFVKLHSFGMTLTMINSLNKHCHLIKCSKTFGNWHHEKGMWCCVYKANGTNWGAGLYFVPQTFRMWRWSSQITKTGVQTNSYNWCFITHTKHLHVTTFQDPQPSSWLRIKIEIEVKRINFPVQQITCFKRVFLSCSNSENAVAFKAKLVSMAIKRQVEKGFFHSILHFILPCARVLFSSEKFRLLHQPASTLPWPWVWLQTDWA